MDNIKRISISQPPWNKEELALVVSGPVMGSVVYAPNGELYQVQDGQMTFDNGYTVSVQFGGGNYCENYDKEIRREISSESPNAEIATWKDDGKLIEFKSWGDTVKGYQSPNNVLTFMNFVASLDE